jgi:hypothetical protein
MSNTRNNTFLTLAKETKQQRAERLTSRRLAMAQVAARFAANDKLTGNLFATKDVK